MFRINCVAPSNPGYSVELSPFSRRARSLRLRICSPLHDPTVLRQPGSRCDIDSHPDCRPFLTLIVAPQPSTNIGAASPVTSTGEDHPETLEAKATEAAAAFIRSIAEERGRNADALEGTVVEAKAYAAPEALDNNMIDLVAKDVDGLIEALDGRKVQL